MEDSCLKEYKEKTDNNLLQIVETMDKNTTEIQAFIDDATEVFTEVQNEIIKIWIIICICVLIFFLVVFSGGL